MLGRAAAAAAAAAASCRALACPQIPPRLFQLRSLRSAQYVKHMGYNIWRMRACYRHIVSTALHSDLSTVPPLSRYTRTHYLVHFNKGDAAEAAD